MCVHVRVYGERGGGTFQWRRSWKHKQNWKNRSLLRATRRDVLVPTLTKIRSNQRFFFFFFTPPIFQRAKWKSGVWSQSLQSVREPMYNVITSCDKTKWQCNNTWLKQKTLINLLITPKLGCVIKSLISHIILPSNCFKCSLLFIYFVNVSFWYRRTGLAPLYKHIIIFGLSLILFFKAKKTPFLSRCSVNSFTGCLWSTLLIWTNCTERWAKPSRPDILKFSTAVARF